MGFFQAIGYTNAMYKAYGQTYISDDHFLSVVGAVAAVFNAGGRVFWGNLSDAYGYRYVAHSTVLSMMLNSNRNHSLNGYLFRSQNTMEIIFLA